MDKSKVYYSRAPSACEVRALDTEDGKKVLTGLAVRFNTPTVLFRCGDIEYKEIISPNALDDCDLSDVVYDRGHDMEGKLLARTRSGTLRLNVTEEGLRYEADVPDTELGRETYELAQRGDLYGSSFAAVIREDSYDRETHTRTILRFERFYDVAAVTFPAYQDTAVSAEMRSAFGIGEDEHKEFELAKARLLASY